MTDSKPQHIATHCWQSLTEHRQKIAQTSLQQMFAEDPQRAAKLTTRFAQIYVDYSKNLITTETMELLLSMAKDAELGHAIERLFAGDELNYTENRAAMHMALRAPADKPYMVGGKNVTPLVHQELQHMQHFVESLHAGEIKGATGKTIETVINIGIGGSDIGVRFSCRALSGSAVTDVNVYFVANVDAEDICSTFERADPETTLFIISSKSFTTRETLLNAESAIKWLKSGGCNAVEQHLLAVTANAHAAESLGIKKEYIFYIWPWVGGRYSLWSAIGLPIAIKIGMPNFRALLSGAFSMDQHFRSQEPVDNLPILLALIDIWYINFFQTGSLAILPYDDLLHTLPAYVGQLFMESNGKQVDHAGNKVGYKTAPIVWGSTGSNAQHAYLQCLHQGTALTPVDFIVSLKSTRESEAHHQEMVANCLAQGAALMNGHTDDTQSVYKDIPGNRPSTTIFMDELSPSAIGSLLCLYEHRCFVQAHLWHINPFDQWGVELGKKLSQQIAAELSDGQSISVHDPSTRGLIDHYLSQVRQTKGTDH